MNGAAPTGAAPYNRAEYAAKASILYEDRRRRARDFPDDILQEPGWDILLFVAMSSFQTEAPLASAVVDCSGTDPTVALRLIQLLEQRDYLCFARRDQGVRISLGKAGERAMARYLDGTSAL